MAGESSSQRISSYADVSAADQARQLNGNIYNNPIYHYTLRQRKSDETVREEQRNDRLLKAAGRGNLKRLQYLIRLGVDIDHSDDQGLTALHHAVLSGFEDCVKELVKVGTDLNAVTAFEETPLNLAAQKKREHILRILLKARADTQQALDRDGIQEAERRFLPSCMGILDSDSESERPASFRPTGDTRSMHVRPNTTPLDGQSEQYDYPTPSSYGIHRGVASNVRRRTRRRQDPSTEPRKDDYLTAEHTFQSGHNTYPGWESFGGLSGSPLEGSRRERPTYSSGFHRYPSMAGMPPHVMQAYAMHGYPYPPSQYASPPPPALIPAAKEDPLEKEVEKLRAMIKQQEDEHIAREEAIIAEAKAKMKDYPSKKEVEALRAMIKQQEDNRIAREEAIIAEAMAKKKEVERLRAMIKQQEDERVAREQAIVAEAKAKEKEDPLKKEVEALRAYIKHQEDDRIAREKAILAEAKAKKLQAEQEALKAKEIAAASTAAKQAAEKAAEDIAKIVKAESDKKLAESEAARMELGKRLEQQQKEHTKREHAIMTEYQAALRKMEAGQGV